MWGTRDHEDKMWFPPEGEAARAAAFLLLPLGLMICSLPLEGEGGGGRAVCMNFREKNLTKESLDMVAVGGWIRMVSMDLNAEASGRGTIFRRIRRCGLAEGSVPLGWALRLLFSWSVDLKVGSADAPAPGVPRLDNRLNLQKLP